MGRGEDRWKHGTDHDNAHVARRPEAATEKRELSEYVAHSSLESRRVREWASWVCGFADVLDSTQHTHLYDKRQRHVRGDVVVVPRACAVTRAEAVRTGSVVTLRTGAVSAFGIDGAQHGRCTATALYLMNGLPEEIRQAVLRIGRAQDLCQRQSPSVVIGGTATQPSRLLHR
jgi:hypothetical protein